MESKILADIKVPIFRPKEEDCQNFREYIERMEKNYNFAKVILPAEMKPRSKSIAANRVLNAVKSISADPIPNTNCANLRYDDQPKMTYAKFSKLAKKTENKFEGKTIEQMEDLFWLGLGETEALYGMDNEFSLFPEDCTVWNLGKFTQNESLIHRNDVRPIPGIHTPFIYVGFTFSPFGFHLEDGNLYSINYNHDGKPKFWYFVPESENENLENLAKSLALQWDCDLYIRHKTLLIPPSVLQKNGIKFARVVQYPGEFIISFSGGYHQGFNLGLNKAEAINFASKRWVEIFHHFILCSCPYSIATREINKQLAEIIEKTKELNLENENQTEPEAEVGTEARTERFQCNKCSLDFKRKKGLQEHERNKHASVKLFFKCTMCHATYVGPTLLKNHYLKVHNVVKTNDNIRKCNSKKVRNTNTAQKQYAISAMSRTTKRKELPCTICSLKFTRAYNLLRHQRKQH